MSIFIYLYHPKMAWERWYAKQRVRRSFRDIPQPLRIALAAPMQFGTSVRKGNLAPGTQTDPFLAWPATHPLAWAENPPSRHPKCHHVPFWCGEDPPMPRSSGLEWNPIAYDGASHDARRREQILGLTTTEGSYLGMGQNLLLPYLEESTSINQLF